MISNQAWRIPVFSASKLHYFDLPAVPAGCRPDNIHIPFVEEERKERRKAVKQTVKQTHADKVASSKSNRNQY
jgi:hypothetical protein